MKLTHVDFRAHVKIASRIVSSAVLANGGCDIRSSAIAQNRYLEVLFLLNFHQNRSISADFAPKWRQCMEIKLKFGTYCSCTSHPFPSDPRLSRLLPPTPATSVSHFISTLTSLFPPSFSSPFPFPFFPSPLFPLPAYIDR